MNTKAIIFSRDRALQLEAVLHSFYLHCSDADSVKVHVLYLATNNRYGLQYRSLAAAYPNVVFIPQKKFRKDVLALMNPFEKGSKAEKVYLFLGTIGSLGTSTGSLLDRFWRHTVGHFQLRLTQTLRSSLTDDSHILFLVDDNIFVRDFQVGENILALAENQKLIGSSLRVGRNTVFCYPHNRAQKVPEFTDINANLVMYDWTQAEYDFGYPLEVSSSIYRLRDILPLLVALRFNSPNRLEEQISSRAIMFGSSRPLLCCYRQSVTFCNPVNMVQTSVKNRAAEQYRYDLEELTRRFDRGERINVNAYSGFVPNGCHQEVELVFEKCTN